MPARLSASSTSNSRAWKPLACSADTRCRSAICGQGFSKSVMRTPTRLVRRALRLRAMKLGRYPSCSAAFSTRSRVLADALAPGVKVRDTADSDTPAARATSPAVTRRIDLSPIIAILKPRSRAAMISAGRRAATAMRCRFAKYTARPAFPIENFAIECKICLPGHHRAITIDPINGHAAEDGTPGGTI
ncbi:hypothetical protein KL86PLE_30276 [uncultured Pleomorphomonas sp.]|uniref:Uncharacterized protein n=1 Tax=uncultured Pleomorphomonas sp. TaxID=442121 RepID=A0A212LEL3_9HYPH|nr:hypothetical protein KL86PLE_30276 [uncultured Pleomorphomonas sp.]